MASQDDLMQSMLGKMYQILTGGDDTAPASKDRFIAWCAPGIPYDKDDLAFAAKGVASHDADEAKQLVAQAADFARLVNLAPDPSGIYDSEQQKTTYEQSGHTMWKAYENALTYSQVASSELDDETKAQIQKFRDLMRVKVKDLMGKEKIEDGPVIKLYNEKLADAESAGLEYNNKRIAAMNSDDPVVVQDWTLNGSTYRSRVRRAHDIWAADGYKNDVDGMREFIRQTTQRDLTLWKGAMEESFNAGKMSDIVSGDDFYFTSFLPAGFANDDAGWTEFKFSEKNVDTYQRSESNSWSASGGVRWGLFGARASASGESSKDVGSFDASNFELGFSMAVVPISRPWFSPEFLVNSAWRFVANKGMSLMSDGEEPPTGQLVAYPTAVIFAKDVRMNCGEVHNKESAFTKSVQGGGSVSYGLFSLGGSYKRSVGERKVSSRITDKGIEVDGLQIIGFKCAVLPKCPNPSPEIEKFV
jgi:hypothetical protein